MGTRISPYLLSLNLNSAKVGIQELTPLGGGLRFYNLPLLKKTEVQLEGDEQELRLSIPSGYLEKF